MTAADQLRELLETRPAIPTIEELTRWWRTSARLLQDMLADLEPPAREPLPPSPLDELAQNLMAEIHAMKFDGHGNSAIRIDRLLDKVHALSVVIADTRIRLLAMERKVGRHG